MTRGVTTVFVSTLTLLGDRDPPLDYRVIR